MDRRNFIKLTAAGAACCSIAMLHSGHAWAKAKKDADAFLPATIQGRNFINLDGPEAIVAGYPLSWWDRHYGMPLHIHYGPVIQANAKAFRGVFNARYPKAEIRFAAKANPHPSVFRLVTQAGEGVDVASEYEAEGALMAGTDPKHMDANGNAKSDEFIRLAIGKGMVIISDSAEEMDLIGRLAKEMNATPRVLQRLSGFSLGNVTASSSFTAGKWTKFGMDIRDINEFFPLLDKHPHLDFLGFHVHIGSPIATLEPYRIVAGKMVEFSQALNARGGRCRMINIGGGFPVNYVNKQQWDWMLDRIRKGYEAVKAGDDSQLFTWHNSASGFEDENTGEINLDEWTGGRFYSDHPKEKMVDDLLAGDIPVNGQDISFVKALKDLGDPILVIEPGRGMVEDSGATLTRVSQVKKVAGGHDLIALDAGVVNFGDAMENIIPMNRWSLASGLDKKDPVPYESFIAGRLCFTGDMPYKYKARLQRKPERGDAMLTWDTGAYTPQFYAANTNAFPRPARVLVLEDGSIEFIKTRDTLEEMVLRR